MTIAAAHDWKCVQLAGDMSSLAIVMNCDLASFLESESCLPAVCQLLTPDSWIFAGWMRIEGADVGHWRVCCVRCCRTQGFVATLMCLEEVLQCCC